MSEMRRLTEIAHDLAVQVSCPVGVPGVLMLQAAVLLAGEQPRYVELAWDDRGDQGLVGTMLLITAHRVIRLTGPRELLQVRDRNPSVDPDVEAETWPVSRLRSARLDGSAWPWTGAGDSVPLPNRCGWLLSFDGPIDVLRLPVSPDADPALRLKAAAVVAELLRELR